MHQRAMRPPGNKTFLGYASVTPLGILLSPYMLAISAASHYIGGRSADRPSGPGRLSAATGRREVAKVNPGEFIRQVRAETAKVVWPTRKETVTTGIMVVILTTLLAIFFFGVDSAFSAIVKALLGLLA